MRKLLRKIILWALDGALDPPAVRPVTHDAAGMDEVIRQTRNGG